jgi:hypothetical protein
VANTAFFAWQLDTPSEHNKRFIWKALVQATQKVAEVREAELSPRPESDTQGVPGTPNIVQTIFERIRQCSVFVADMSFVGTTSGGRGKKIPNPNVLIELGYASRSIGWDRTVLVLNEAYGPAGNLPFDILQHRWPIEYRVTNETQVRERKFDKLSSALESALKDCEQHALSRAREMAAALDTECLGFVARHETARLIDMPLPARTVGEHLTGINLVLVVRRLMQLGALEVVAVPDNVGYVWTHDGRNMIEQAKKLHPALLDVFRRHSEQPPAQANPG